MLLRRRGASWSPAAASLAPGSRIIPGHPLQRGVGYVYDFRYGGSRWVNDATGRAIRAGFAGATEPTWVNAPGRLGQALRFQAAGYLDSAHHPYQGAGGQHLTIVAVIYPTTFANFQMLVCKTTGAGVTSDYELRLEQTSGLPRLLRNSGSSITGTVAPTLNAWNVLVATVHSKGSAHYLNGRLNGSDATVRLGTAISDPVKIGQRNDLSAAFNFIGSMAFVGVWRRGFTPDEVQAISADPFHFLEAPGTALLSGLAGLPAEFAANVNLTLSATGGLSVGTAQFAGLAAMSLGTSADLTSDQRLIGSPMMTLTTSAARLRAARFAHRLAQCGHPIATQCDSFFEED